MSKMEKFLSLIILIICTNQAHAQAKAQAWFSNCSYQYTIPTTSTTYFTSNNYPARYNSGDSNKWYLTAPVGYTIQLTCQYNLDTPLPNCQSQTLYISRDGDKDLKYAETYCGYSSAVRTSVGNEISFGYTSTSNQGGSGWVYCAATTVLTTQTNCQCGWSKTSRIVNGVNAQPNEYVSVAGLIDASMKGASDGPIFCGGAIISEFYTLTAGHCFNVKRKITDLGVLVGDNDISTADDTPYPALYTVQKIIIHASYVPTSDNQNNDIALVQTNDQIRWKRTIGPACLPFSYAGVGPTYENYFNGYDLVVLGWGTQELAGPTSNILKKTSLTVISNPQCNITYADINKDKICTYKKGTDSCQRDSGGSLYWTYSGHQYTIGIVSYGKYCAGPDPAVNTRVTSYIDWIQKQAPGAFFCQK